MKTIHPLLFAGASLFALIAACAAQPAADAQDAGLDPKGALAKLAADDVSADGSTAPEVVSEPEPSPTEAEAATPAAAAPVAPPAVMEAVDVDAEIANASAYLNALELAQARFVQENSIDGSYNEGTFYLQRPGRLRIEVDNVEAGVDLIVADGATVAQRTADLGQVERVPIRAHPFHVILKSDIDLSRDTKIERVTKQDGVLAITMSDPDGEIDGTLTLIFASPTLELRGWRIVDGVGFSTTVTLMEVSREATIEPEKFVLRDPRPTRRGGGR